MYNPSKSFLISVASSLVAVNLVLACVASADSVDQQVEALLQQLTLEEKINYINGAPPGTGSPNSTGANIRAVPRLGLPELATADGPVGIRVPASSSTRYPANLLLAATWDPERAGDEGIAIGRNARARGFHIWFGPGANMYRVPVGGRNSEYLCGEDPWLGSQLVVPFIRGAQAQKDPGTLFYISIGVPVASVGLAWASIDPPVNLGTYDAVVITAGFDQSYESEGGDRPYDLPEYQDDLIQKMAAANRHTVVVLHGGGGMGIQKWVNQVQALIHTFFPGQDGGRALVDILFGDVNPSGKLPFTFEKRFQDNPAYANYPVDLSVDPTGNTAVYKEGIFVGYRGFDKNGVEPQYPFGYGLSYTTFSYSDLEIERAKFKENDRQAGSDGEKHGLVKATFNEHDDKHQDLAKVSFTVTNTGECAGLEIAQLYVSEKNPTVPRPIKELKGFQKVFLRPGESRRVTLELDQRSFAYFNTATSQWDALPDTYDILVGASSRDLPLKAQFTLKSELTSKP